MVDEKWYIVADFEMMRFCWNISKLWGKNKIILIDVRFVLKRGQIFPIQPILLKGIHIYSLVICDLFLDVKMENEVFGQIQKDTLHKTGTNFKTQI